MRPTKPLRLAMLGILVLATTSYAQRSGDNGFPSRPQPHSLRIGIREDGTERPIAGAEVQAHGMRGATISGTTNGAGECFLTDLPTDTYQVSVTAAGYDSGSGNIDLSADSDLVLRIRRNGLSDAPGGNTVSVRALQLPAKARESYEHGLKELYTKHNAAKSLTYFRDTLRDAPDFYEAHHQMGVAYEQMEHLEDAENEYKEAIRMSDGQFGPSQFCLAALFSGRKDFVSAEGAARKGLESSPQSGLGHYELARALLGQGKLDPAEQEANISLEEARKLPKAYLVLAAIHDQRHEPGKVFHDLTEYLKLVPTGATSDRMRVRLEEIRQEMQKQNSAAGNPPASPATP